MQKEKLEKNIKLFMWFKILHEPIFWGPILISFILNVGKMSLAEFYFMESIVVFLMIFSEIYSSAWADLLGRKKTIIIGSFLSLISIILFTMVNSPLLVWISNVLIMVGASIVSGADEAFLADTLKDANRSDDFLKILAKINSRKFVIIAISSILSGYLYTINPRLPIALSIPAVLISFILTFFIDEPRRLAKASHKDHFNLIKISILFVANNKAVKWIIAYTALITVVSKLWFFTYNPYFELVELNPKYFGWLFFLLNIVAWFSSKYAYNFVKTFKEKTILIWMILIIALPIFLMGFFVGKFAVLLVLMENISRGFRQPFFSKFINQHLDSKNRATILSISSATIAIISSCSLFIFGLIINDFSLPISLQLLSIVMLVLGMILIYKYKIIFQKK